MNLISKNKELAQAALFLQKNDFVVTNVQLVNVLSKEILAANVYVKGKNISYVDYHLKNLPDGLAVIDGKGQYLLPGLIDTHMHIESTMLTPQRFADLVAPLGTTTVVCDPHEVANVFGITGVEYVAQCGQNLPMRQLIDVPSCVPSVEGLEKSGATFHDREVSQLLELDSVVGLAEVMDYEGVIHQKERMTEIITAVKDQGYYIQGHCPLLSGQRLAAYRIGGPVSDHEATSIEEIQEKVRNGFYIDIRESNTNRNLGKFIQTIKDWKCLDRFTFCTDDRRTNVILREGHINGLVKKAITNGMDPIDAISFATINAAQEIKAEDLGAIAPGYIADMILVHDLKQMRPSIVIFEGQVVAKEGKIFDPTQETLNLAIEKRSSMNIPTLKTTDFLIAVPKEKKENQEIIMNVMAYESFTSSFTHLEQDVFKIKDSFIDLADKKDMMYAMVINRHGEGTFSVCATKAFGIDHGALATTVSHDSHNVTLVYDTPSNAKAALTQLVAQRGGMVAVEDGQVIASLPLAVAGLMSDEEPAELVAQIDQMTAANRKLGNTYLENPVSRITILALLVSPFVKLSDLGLVDTQKQEFISLFN
ncbi:MAG TPA: adenine deaminase C-terminal domain-containing protein [Tetragenococcus sp.]|nr:adenine deaminase C-terminal domain-containing protein [Tetragenococcus sp.]